jgi:hypothetical protein
VKSGNVYTDGNAAVSKLHCEAPDDIHIGGNTQCTSDLKFKVNFKILSFM